MWLKLHICKIGARGFVPRYDIQESEKQMFLPPPSLVKIQYCGMTLWSGSSVHNLRPPVLEFWILCPEGSVIWLISTSQMVHLVHFSLHVHKSSLSPILFVNYSFILSFCKHTQVSPCLWLATVICISGTMENAGALVEFYQFIWSNVYSRLHQHSSLKHTTALFSLSDHCILSWEWRVLMERMERTCQFVTESEPLKRWHTLVQTMETKAFSQF